ncbi:NAD(+)/NADH kinase (plasmid) [Paracoccus sp. TK19116]|uniref:NAD(+)/NADH kinase n=1 Tax=Paracoccus albicereus TaxID=2922394 RepID=A0ABT1MQH4_9RHOB|nr:diacylglycerol kinase family protein [Paracoccus albicereus]MCQ0969181.1 NAD(+)/NADH kinase [Paracoccus albicereus]
MPQNDQSFDLSAARVCAVLNKGSGRKNGDQNERMLRERLEGRSAAFEIRKPAHGSQIGKVAKQAIADGFDVILAVGGDGTQAAVAQALARTDAVMGVIPTGTFNYFARELRCGEDVEGGIDTILDARLSTISVGEVNGRIFLNNVSFGAYPEILQRREAIYRRWGRSRVAAYWSVLAALKDMRHPMSLTASVDGVERHYETALAFIGKSAFQLETFGLDEGAQAVRDGHLALFVAKANGPMALIRAALRLAFGKTARDDDFDLITSDEIEIDTGRGKRLIAHDGEKSRVRGPFKLRALPEALNVLVPAQIRDTGRAAPS